MKEQSLLRQPLVHQIDSSLRAYQSLCSTPLGYLFSSIFLVSQVLIVTTVPFRRTIPPYKCRAVVVELRSTVSPIAPQERYSTLKKRGAYETIQRSFVFCFDNVLCLYHSHSSLYSYQSSSRLTVTVTTCIAELQTNRTTHYGTQSIASGPDHSDFKFFRGWSFPPLNINRFC